MADHDDPMMHVRAALVARCLDDECYELAVAINRGTGLPIVGLWSATESGDDGVPGTWRHAAVRLPDGRFHDARGPVTERDLMRPFLADEVEPPREITEADLLAVRPIGHLETITRLAEAAWPDLPWGPTSYRARTAAFLDELGELSRRHGIWIRSPYPAARPFLAEGDEDEKGYDARQTDDGLGITFDRTYEPGPRR